MSIAIKMTFREGEYDYHKEKIVVLEVERFSKKLVIEEASKINEFDVFSCLVGYSLAKYKVVMGRKTYSRYTKITKKYVKKDDKFIMTHNIKLVRSI